MRSTMALAAAATVIVLLVAAVPSALAASDCAGKTYTITAKYSKPADANAFDATLALPGGWTAVSNSAVGAGTFGPSNNHVFAFGNPAALPSSFTYEAKAPADPPNGNHVFGGSIVFSFADNHTESGLIDSFTVTCSGGSDPTTNPNDPGSSSSGTTTESNTGSPTATDAQTQSSTGSSSGRVDTSEASDAWIWIVLGAAVVVGALVLVFRARRQ